ncbi:hypothetical protein HNQ80_004335 [Anaerosolibacter carboniphilus]|uniref:HNH domain-containing protein n=1 Tax=Anaerosolibacter carboniphilus TaxID=1417629 RepID=A0A841L7E8_9FIRM|nr:HNH endonuclease [Anaerosolibacter carboniphilus]MBB6218195.1 hypothetical protein [Anaerosolibacter carboniphilus]
MAKYAVLKSFYASEKWINFRLFMINERMKRDKKIICEHCSKEIERPKDITIHHIEELTPENVHDVMISLNPKNVMLVHHECHNKIHNRFGHKPARNVYIVFGAPMAGKKTYVKENMSRGDIVVDMDNLYSAVSFLPYYDKPDNLFNNVINIHNALIDNIKTRYGKWNNAWVIGGYTDKYKREKLADDLGAEIIFCDVSRDECIRRLELDQERMYRKDEWLKYINKWFDEYVA